MCEIKSLEFPEIKRIRFQKFKDSRGFFVEHFRKSGLTGNSSLNFFKGIEFIQANQSYSKEKVLRGMHFQWNPSMGKLIRTISGNMIDLMLDIRKNSPTYGKMIAYNLSDLKDKDYGEWIWIPDGFAHGFFTLEDTFVEYFCSGEYTPKNEAGISPLSESIDWSLCAQELKKKFDEFSSDFEMSEKDKNAIKFSDWKDDLRSKNFIYSKDKS